MSLSGSSTLLHPKGSNLMMCFCRSDSDDADGESGPVDSAASGRALQGAQVEKHFSYKAYIFSDSVFSF